MKKNLKDLAKLVLPLGAEKRKALELASSCLDDQDWKTVRHYLKMDWCFARIERFGTNEELFEDKEWPVFKSHTKKELKDFFTSMNEKIQRKIKEEAFDDFSEKALEKITEAIAPNIIGMDTEKQAAAVQLFAVDPVHLLLIGDPGTGKTDILRSADQIAPISSFGLGSGVSGVGLSAAGKGDELLKGLLPLADGGICCIDELNLIKARDLAALYNAMEKGFVNYDKGGKHETLAADVRVCATANPTNSTFVGRTAEVLRKQMPFEDALLSRFHFIFVIRKPSDEEFEKITKKIVQGKKVQLAENDATFLGEYVRHAWEKDVDLDSELELKIVDFVKSLKKDERKFLVELGPRTVVGIVRIVKAVARSFLEETVNQQHLDIAFALIKKALYRE
ncbi:MAG: ATP-binding protein [Candidatus Woesearchaeota archaeon]|nr:ATP-binding protein [Candidatus Woesearchaeota archaeon]